MGFGGKAAMESRWGAGVEGKEQKGRDGMACVSGETIDGDPLRGGLGEIVLPQIARRTPSGYTTIGTEQKEISVGF